MSKRPKVHMKVAGWTSGSPVCGQAGNVGIVYGYDAAACWRRVTCKRCKARRKRESGR